MASYILGLPGETEDTVSETIKFADNLGAGYGLHVLAPFPGTEVREKAENYGIRILTDDWDLYDANRAVCDTGGISPEKITGIADNFYNNLRLYFNRLEHNEIKGIELKTEEYEILRGLKSFNFCKKLISDEIVEKFPGIGEDQPDEQLITAFSDFICNSTDINPEEALREINRLLKLKCIKKIHENERVRFTWII